MSDLGQVIFILLFIFPFVILLTAFIVAFIIKKRATCIYCVKLPRILNQLDSDAKATAKWIRNINYQVGNLESQMTSGNLVEIQQMLMQFNEEMFGYIPEHEQAGSDYERTRH